MADDLDDDVQGKVDALIGQVSQAADKRADLERVDDEIAKHERLKETVKNLQGSLDALRLSVKYLVFDLEATRRENLALRKLLQDKK